jgi:hypothetical protein
MSNNITAFILGLSAYEGEHAIFGLLSLTSRKMMFSSFVHLLANDKISFFVAE